MGAVHRGQRSASLPEDQPLVRVNNRYSPKEVLTVSKGSGALLAVFLLVLGARALAWIADLMGDDITLEDLLAAVGLVGGAGIAIYFWERRTEAG